MTWFKVDDGLHSHRKVKSLPRKERMAALGLWVLAGSWCADNLTDGHVPDYMVPDLGGTLRQAQHLVTSGLWVQVEDGYLFHGWTDAGRQPTRADVEANREYERKRKADQREQRRLSHRDTPRSPAGSPDGTPTGVPPGVRAPRPDPTRPVLSSGLGSQSELTARTPTPTDDRLKDIDIQRIATILGSDIRWATRVTTQILDRAPAGIRNPQAYIEAAIREHPDNYKPTPTPPTPDQLCHEHGRARDTCPFHQEATP